MERTFEFRDRQSSGTRDTPLGSLTAVRYASGGIVYSGLPAGVERLVVIFPDRETPFYGITKKIEPFGSVDIEQPHLRLTVDGEPLVSYN